jgi:hypothetical protein
MTSLADITAQTFTGGTILGMTPNNSFDCKTIKVIISLSLFLSAYTGYYQLIMVIISVSWLCISISWESIAYHGYHQPIMVIISQLLTSGQ